MKCTWSKKLPDGKVVACGKPTGKACPPIWIKLKDFHPTALRIFFEGISGEEYLPLLKAFVCQEHMPEYLASIRASEIGKKGAQTRKARKQEDYSI